MRISALLSSLFLAIGNTRAGWKTVGSTTPPRVFCWRPNGEFNRKLLTVATRRKKALTFGFALRHNGRLRTRRSHAPTPHSRILKRNRSETKWVLAVINLCSSRPSRYNKRIIIERKKSELKNKKKVDRLNLRELHKREERGGRNVGDGKQNRRSVTIRGQHSAL